MSYSLYRDADAAAAFVVTDYVGPDDWSRPGESPAVEPEY